MKRLHVPKNHQKDLGVIRKDPDSIVWVELVWDAFLGSDTVSSTSNEINGQSTLDRGSSLSIDSEENDQSVGNFSHVSRVKLSGGFPGDREVVTNRIVTSNGETVDASFQVWVQSI